MFKRISLLLSLTICISIKAISAPNDSLAIRALFNEAMEHGQGYGWLKDLCKNIGPRMAGSTEAGQAIEWGKTIMQKMGLSKVYLQEITVPHWERGAKEKGQVTSNALPIGTLDMHICALGGSIATPKDGLNAEVIEVKDFDELARLGRTKIKGKIVFFNRPMDPKQVSTFDAYGGAVNQRGSGAVMAARYGAVGVLVRSMNLSNDNYPHTGAMHYADTVTKIPAAAISTTDADLLSSLIRKDASTRFFIKMNCQSYPDEKSFNVIGEIKGTEFPNEIITVGGHLDSWDLGEGAQDDGTGCVQSMEALRIFKALDIKPKRTIRAVLFMNEEFGLRGGTKYFEEAADDKANKYIAAIETDRGGLTPRGFSIDTAGQVLQKIIGWKTLFAPYSADQFVKGGSGADIYKLKGVGAVCMELIPDSQRYFDYHHSALDVFENVNKRELEMGAGTIASLIFLLSEYGVK